MREPYGGCDHGVLVRDNGKIVQAGSRQLCNQPIQCVCYQIHVSGSNMARGRASLCPTLSIHQRCKEM